MCLHLPPNYKAYMTLISPHVCMCLGNVILKVKKFGLVGKL